MVKNVEKYLEVKTVIQFMFVYHIYGKNMYVHVYRFNTYVTMMDSDAVFLVFYCFPPLFLVIVTLAITLLWAKKKIKIDVSFSS